MKTFAVALSLTLYLFLIYDPTIRVQSSSDGNNDNRQCKAWLVQSIPTDMPHLSHVRGVLSTGKLVLYSFSVSWNFYWSLYREEKRKKKENTKSMSVFNYLVYNFENLYPSEIKEYLRQWKC